MKIILYDDEVSLPNRLGDHMLVRTGNGESILQDGAVITTDVNCVYSIGPQVVEFRINAESVNLRFEDALLWAVRYATKVGIKTVFAVFSISRPIDSRFIAKLGAVQIYDERRGATRDTKVFSSAPSSNVFTMKPPLRKAFRQRRLIVRMKGRGERIMRPERQYFAHG